MAGHSSPRAAGGLNSECRPLGTLQHKELSNAICLKRCIQCFLQTPPSVPQNPHDYSAMLGDVQNKDLEAVYSSAPSKSFPAGEISILPLVEFLEYIYIYRFTVSNGEKSSQHPG